MSTAAGGGRVSTAAGGGRISTAAGGSRISTTAGGDLILTLDAGTSSAKAVVFDREGAIHGQSSRSWRPRCPAALKPFGREFDPHDALSAIIEAARAATSRLDPERIAVVSATGQRIACAFCDENLRTLYLGPNRDVRGLLAPPNPTLEDPRLYALTGQWPAFLFAPARLHWFAVERPELRQRIRYILGSPSWLALQLCGRLSAEPSIAASLMCMDVLRGCPAGEVLSALELPPDALGPMHRSTDVLGPVSDAVASALAIPRGTPVVVAGADTQLALLGAGHYEQGVAVVAGSSAPVIAISERPEFHDAGRRWVGRHVHPARFTLEANAGEMGTMHRFLLELLGLGSGPSAYASYEMLAASSPAGSRGALSHLGPRAFDLGQINTGRPAGILLPFGETTQVSVGRADVARSYLESCAFAVRANLELLGPAAGKPTLTLLGGMGRSRLFAQILAAVLDRAIWAAPPSASGRGAAICAAVAKGWWTTVEEACARMVPGGETLRPDSAHREVYDGAYERWQENEAHLEKM